MCVCVCVPQAKQLQIRNEEVRRSIEDLLHLVRTYPRENATMQLDESDLRLFMRHYSKLMYQAILTCTQKSLQAMKKRLGSKTHGGFLYMERPFFDVDVELKVGVAQLACLACAASMHYIAHECWHAGEERESVCVCVVRCPTLP